MQVTRLLQTSAADDQLLVIAAMSFGVLAGLLLLLRRRRKQAETARLLQGAAGTPEPFVSGRRRAQAVTILFLIGIVIDLAIVASLFSQHDLIARAGAGERVTQAEALANDSRLETLGQLQVISLLATAVFFILWLDRARRNLPALGARDLKYGPGWVLFGFVVPLVNLVRPYQVVKEVWKASDPAAEDGTAATRERLPGSAAIGGWWVFWLLADGAARLANRYGSSQIESLDGLASLTRLFIAFEILRILAALLATRVVRGIDARQERKSQLVTTPGTALSTAEPAPVSGEMAEKAKEHLERGQVYASTHDHDYAIVEYNLAIGLDPRLAAAYYARGLSYHQKGNIDIALADYDMAVRLDPGLIEAYYNRGVLNGARGEYDRAIADFDRVLLHNPQDADAHYNRAIAYSNKGDYSRAIADLNKTIAFDPQCSDAYFLRGTIHHRIAESAKAAADLGKAVELGLGPTLQQEAEALLVRLQA